jgi:hypothetical protein
MWAFSSRFHLLGLFSFSRSGVLGGESLQLARSLHCVACWLVYLLQSKSGTMFLTVSFYCTWAGGDASLGSGSPSTLLRKGIWSLLLCCIPSRILNRFCGLNLHCYHGNLKFCKRWELKVGFARSNSTLMSVCFLCRCEKRGRQWAFWKRIFFSPVLNEIGASSSRENLWRIVSNPDLC